MVQNYSAILHLHGLWFVAIILFVLSIVFINSGKEKLAKIFQMTLRLFYVILAISGAVLIYINDFHFYSDFRWEVYVKGILALWLIFVMEMLTTRLSKGTLDSRGKASLWVQFAIALILVLYFGFMRT